MQSIFELGGQFVIATSNAIFEIVRFARARSRDIRSSTFEADIHNPSLVFVAPDVASMLPDIMKNWSNFIQLNHGEMLEQSLVWLSKNARIFVDNSAVRTPADHTLLHFGDDAPPWLNENYEEITHRTWFHLAILGCKHAFFVREFDTVAATLLALIERLEHPNEFRARVEKGEWQTPTSAWMAWIRFQMDSKEAIDDILNLVNSSMSRLNALDYVGEYLRRGDMLLAELDDDLDGDALMHAVEQRKKLAQRLGQVLKLLEDARDLDDLSLAVSSFGVLNTVEFLEPPVARDILDYINSILRLVDMLEHRVIGRVEEINEELQDVDMWLKSYTAKPQAKVAQSS